MLSKRTEAGEVPLTHSTIRAFSLRNLLFALQLLTVAVISHLLTRLPTWDHPMYGDDFLGVRVATMPIRDGSLWENIWLVGGGKWRPVTTSVLLWIGSRWGFSYPPYQILNSVLLIFLATSSGFMCWIFGGRRLASLMTSVAVTVSQFTWMSQISIYGVMELLAGIFLLLMVYFTWKVENTDTPSISHARIASLFLLLASFTHERFLLCALPLVAYLAMQKVCAELRSRSWEPLLVPLLHLFLKGLLLRMDPVAGGGESDIQASAGPWILGHLLDSVKMLLGAYSGAGFFYSPNAITKLHNYLNLGNGAFIASALMIVFVVLVTKRLGIQNRAWSPAFTVFLGATTIAALLPAATVVERIEGRWILVPQMLLLMSLGAWTGHSPRRLFTAVGVIFASLTLCFGLWYLPTADSLLALRDQPSVTMSMIENVAPSTGDWVLVISQEDSTAPVSWQFGYGDALSQLVNPPYITYINTLNRGLCPVMRRTVTCVVVKLRGLDVPNSPVVTQTRAGPQSENRR